MRILNYIFFFVSILLFSCEDKCEYYRTYTIQKPLYETKQKIRDTVNYVESREINNPGKLNYKDGFIFISEIGKGIHLKNAGDVLLVTTGITTQIGLQTSESLSKENIDCGVFHMHTIKPFDYDGLFQASESVKLIITIEEHVLNGGLGSAVLEAFSDHGLEKKVIRLGIPDVFAKKYGSQELLMSEFGLDQETIFNLVVNHIK